MDQRTFINEINLLDAALTIAVRRLLNHVRAGKGDPAESEAFQCYQLIENLAALADKAPNR